MSIFELANEHPLAKAGLRCVHLVEESEPGLRLGEIVFEFPFGRIVDTGMACRRDGIIPLGVDLMAVHKEALAIRAASREISEKLAAINILPLRRTIRRSPPVKR
jgi:hypothetical protein